jgi:hypothetical protein
MSRVEVRDLGEPEAVVTYPLGMSAQARLGGTVVTRHVLQPGWSWEEHAQALVGTTSCELYHRGVVLRGRMGVRTDEGDRRIIEPNHVFDLPPRAHLLKPRPRNRETADRSRSADYDARHSPSARSGSVVRAALATACVR